MDLYFAPLACSMATRIALYEAGADAGYIYVDTSAKRVDDGGDFLEINPLGQVPVIRTDDGRFLTENSAILQYVARRSPGAGLLGSEAELPWTQQWVSFVSTEIHKAVFTPLFDKGAGEDAKAAARDKAAPRFDIVDRHLAGREYLLERFTVADAYLFTVLNWCRATGIDLGRWPNLKSYHSRLRSRPSIARAMGEENALYAAEQAKKAA